MFAYKLFRWLAPVLIVCLLFIQGCGDDGDNNFFVNEPAPDFSMALFTGGEFRLADHKGKPALINFFASWCIPCGKESPVLEKIYQEYRRKGVTFVGVAVNDTETKAKGFIEKFGLTFPAGLDKTGEIKDAYSLYGMPSTYFVDKEGIISYFHPGGVTERLLKHELDKLL